MKFNKTALRRYLKLTAAVLSFVLLVITLALKQFAPATYEDLQTILRTTQPGMYQVVEVFDGDTIAVRGTNNQVDKVRFIGIDTPEKDHPRKPVQCFSYEATGHLKELLGDSDIKLEADPTNTNRDRYDRLLRYVYLPDGTLLNAKMIEDGYAFAYTSFPVTKMDEFLRLEKEAREANRGLWGSCEIEQNNGYINTNPI